MKVTPAPFYKLDVQLRSIGSTGLGNNARSLHDSCGSEEIRVVNPVSSFRKKTRESKSATKADKQERSVKFLVDEKDNMITDVQTFQKYSKAELDDIFWSSNERVDFLHTARYDCDDVTLDEGALLDDLDDIHSMSFEMDHETSRETMSKWVLTVGRGLERSVMVSIRRSRKKHNKAVLKCQAKHWEKGTSIGALTKVLRSQSRKSSIKASNFAELMALADEYAASSDAMDTSR